MALRWRYVGYIGLLISAVAAAVSVASIIAQDSNSTPIRPKAIKDLEEAMVEGLWFQDEDLQTAWFESRDALVGNSVTYEIDFEVEADDMRVSLPDEDAGNGMASPSFRALSSPNNKLELKRLKNERSFSATKTESALKDESAPAIELQGDGESRGLRFPSWLDSLLCNETVRLILKYFTILYLFYLILDDDDEVHDHEI